MKKELILSEIKRTANKNDGVPLGIDRFKEETGIRKEDWYGIYWAKWSEAQIEAGFVPNQFGEPALDEGWMLEKIALYIRELGHFPTKPEFKLKKRHDAEFPNITTLRNRLGTKVEMVNRILEHFRSREEWKDIIDICSALQNSIETKDWADENTDDSISMIGHVYLLQHENTYKIGRSLDASRRYKEVRIQNTDAVPDQRNTCYRN